MDLSKQIPYLLKFNERGHLAVFDENDNQLPCINAIKVAQSVDEMRAGIARVELTLFVRVPPVKK